MGRRAGGGRAGGRPGGREGLTECVRVRALARAGALMRTRRRACVRAMCARVRANTHPATLPLEAGAVRTCVRSSLLVVAEALLLVALRDPLACSSSTLPQLTVQDEILRV